MSETKAAQNNRRPIASGRAEGKLYEDSFKGDLQKARDGFTSDITTAAGKFWEKLKKGRVL